MSGIAQKIAKPAGEILDYIAKRIPQAMAKAHHRVGQMAHDAADHFDKVEEELAAKARIHSPHGGRDHEPGGGGGGFGGAGHDRHSAGHQGHDGGSDGVPAGPTPAERAREGAKDPVRSSRPLADRCTGGDPIDLVSGEMIMQEADADLPGVLPLLLARTHLSGYRSGRLFGPAWASTLDERLEADTAGLVLATEDGLLLVYPVPDPSGPVLPAHGPRWPLEWDGTAEGDIRVTDPATGRTRHFSPPAEGSANPFDLHLSAVTDRHGNRVTIDRDADGTPTAVHHSGGYRIAVDSHEGRVTALRLLGADPAQPGTTLREFRYDPVGNLSGIVNGTGLATRLDHDAHGRVIRWTDRNGSWYRFDYDEQDRCTAGTGADGFLSCVLAYDTEARTTAYTDSLGHTTLHAYDELLRRTRVTDPLGNEAHTTWDAHGRALSHTDALGNTSTYGYDAAGNLRLIVNPDGTQALAVHNELGLPVETTDPGGATWRHTWDPCGNLLATQDPVGAVTRYEYGDHGHLLGVTDPLGGTRRFTRDAAGLPVAVTDPTGLTTTLERDAFGRITGVTDVLGRTVRLSWSTEGRLERREQADGTHEAWTWDAEGNPLTHTDAAGHRTDRSSTHFDLPATRTDPDGTRYAFSYDTELRLVAVTNPEGLTWSYGYDPAGRLTSESDFDGRTLHYAHDAAGRLVARTNGAGETHRFERDNCGLITRVTNAEGEVTSFEYDAAGEMVRAFNDDADLTVLRDPLGRTLSETVNGRTISYSYDAAGRRVSRHTPSGVRSSWSYDAAGRHTALATGDRRLEFGYDAAGRETERRLGDGIVLTQKWDDLDRLTSQSLTSPVLTGTGPATQPPRRDYSYRADGFVTRVRDLDHGTVGFGLTRTGRINTVRAEDWSETYAYDGSGNIVHGDDPGHEVGREREFAGTVLRRIGRTHYEHDAQGRTIRTTRRLLNGQHRVWEYAWNSDDRLVGCVTPDGTRWRYLHDPSGRRIAKQRLDSDGLVTQRIEFTWDGTVLAEQTTDGAADFTWEYVPGTHQPLTQTEVDDRFHAIVTDLVGAPAELVSPDGEIVRQGRASVWGEGLTGTQQSCPLRFPGQYHDPETGWNHNFFRHYDPGAGRYTTPDPLGLLGGPNPYAYVHNPLQGFDPLGLADCKTARKTHEDTLARAAQGKRKLSGKYHGHLTPERELEIIKNADGVYLSDGQKGRLIYHHGEDVVVVESGGSGRGNIITSYGPSGPRNESGAKALGGSPDDPGLPITRDMIVGGGIQTPKGGTLPPAAPLDL